MFSALSQGSLIHILEKTDGLKYRIGEVIGITQPSQFGGTYSNPSFINPSTPITIKVNVNGEIREFPEVASGQTVMSYNGGRLIISENVQGIQNEIESIHKRNKQILANREYYEKEIQECETIMKELNPQFAQNKERDDRINNLESKLDLILKALSKTNTTEQVKIKT